MFITIRENHSGKPRAAKISGVKNIDLPLKKDGWQFSWRQLSKIKGAQLYKLTLLDAQKEIEGMLMISLQNEEMVCMNNVEIAPRNYGGKGKFIDVAGCLIAFACHMSFEQGKGNYYGFLSFESKTQLIGFTKKNMERFTQWGRKCILINSVKFNYD